jgi:hypothetical protein
LGFLGLAHALIEVLAGKPHQRDPLPGRRGLAALTATAVLLLAGLTAVAAFLPGSALVAALARGLS